MNTLLFDTHGIVASDNFHVNHKLNPIICF